MIGRVQGSTTPRYKLAVLSATPEIAAKVVAMEARIKDRFTRTVLAKGEYILHIPHGAVGIFAKYYGYAVDVCKARLRDCFAEYRRLLAADPSKLDNLSMYFFSEESVCSQQLCQIAFGVGCNSCNLHQTPEAFVEVQERAFLSFVARYVEAEHKKTKCAITRGLRFTKAAYGCSRQRNPQVVQALQKSEEMDFMVNHWVSTSKMLS